MYVTRDKAVGSQQSTVDSQQQIDSIACPVKRDPVYRDISRGIE
jgi:hypothetical protein